MVEPWRAETPELTGSGWPVRCAASTAIPAPPAPFGTAGPGATLPCPRRLEGGTSGGHLRVTSVLWRCTPRSPSAPSSRLLLTVGLAAGASRPPRQHASSEKKRKRELAPPGKGRRPKDKAKPLRLCSTKPLWGRRGSQPSLPPVGVPPGVAPRPLATGVASVSRSRAHRGALRLSPRVGGCP